jgi:hypothetical protein
MTMHALAHPASTTVTLRVLDGGAPRRPAGWWERRAALRALVGGCPDHWWKATAPRTERCTCDRF